MKRTFFFILFFVLVSLQCLTASLRLVIQSGHEGPAVEIAWHNTYRYIVSSGVDGRIIITRPGDGRVLHRFRVSPGPVFRMTLDPSASRVGVVYKISAGYRLAVWDWEREEEVFSKDLPERPLYVTWSAQGRYLLYGRAEAPSLVVLDGRTGRPLNYLKKLPSLYNYAYVGSKENTLMTYSTGGTLTYWDIKTTRQKGIAETIPGLSGTEVIQTREKRFMVGQKGDSLLVIDRLTGATENQVAFPGLISMSIDPQKGEVDVLTRKNSGTQLRTWTVTPFPLPEETLEEEDELPLEGREAAPLSLEESLPLTPLNNLSSGVSAHLRAGGYSILVDGTGTFYILDDSSFTPQKLIRENPLKTESAAFTGDSLYVSAGSRILRFQSSFFTRKNYTDFRNIKDLQVDEVHLPGQTEGINLLPHSPGQLLLWEQGGSTGYQIFDFDTPGLVSTEWGSIPLRSLKTKEDGRVLALDENGGVTLYQPLTGEVDFRHSALGLQAAEYIPQEDYLMVGRTTSAQRRASLEMIDIRTGESLSLFDDRFLVYSIKAGSRSLYSLGLLRDSTGAPRTVLRSHNPVDPARSRMIDSADGEDLDALILPHPQENTLFTTLGDGTPRALSNGRIRLFPGEEPIRKLWLNGPVLYGLDYEGILNLWNIRSGELFLRAGFFQDGSWIALSPEEDRFWSSPDALEHVVLYKGRKLVDPERLGTVINTSSSSLLP